MDENGFGLPNSQAEVENLLTRVSGSLTTTYTNWGGDNKVIQQLQKFSAKLKEQTIDFYNDTGLGNLQNFQKEYDKLMQQRQWFTTSEQEELIKKYATEQEPLDKQKIVEAFLDVVNNEIRNNRGEGSLYEKLTEAADEQASIVLQNYLAEISKKNPKTVKFSSQKTGSKSTKRKTGLARLNLKQAKNTKTNKNRREGDLYIISEELPLSKTYLKKLADYVYEKTGNKLNGVTEDDSNFNKEAFFSEARHIVTSRSPGHGYLFDHFAKSIELNSSRASLKGFFGEMIACLQLSSLLPKTSLSEVQATGKMLKSFSGQQLPIDVVLQGLKKITGFQIKNYTPNKNGEVTFKNSLIATTFLKDRLCVSGELMDILMEFFASFQYNQVFKEKKQGDGWTISPEQYKTDTYQDFKDIIGGGAAKKFFDSHIGNLLKIVDVFSTQSGPFQKQGAYYNTFFIIANKIIPSYVIIDSMIDSINNQKSYIDSSYSMQNTNNKNTWQFNRNNPNFSLTKENLAAMVKVRYYVRININIDTNYE